MMPGSGQDRPNEGDAEGQGTAIRGSRWSPPAPGLANFKRTRFWDIRSGRKLIIKTLRLCRVGARRITLLLPWILALPRAKARNELNFARRSGVAGLEL
jgi:hypothetical protein